MFTHRIACPERHAHTKSAPANETLPRKTDTGAAHRHQQCVVSLLETGVVGVWKVDTAAVVAAKCTPKCARAPAASMARCSARATETGGGECECEYECVGACVSECRLMGGSRYLSSGWCGAYFEWPLPRLRDAPGSRTRCRSLSASGRRAHAADHKCGRVCQNAGERKRARLLPRS